MLDEMLTNTYLADGRRACGWLDEMLLDEHAGTAVGMLYLDCKYSLYLK